MKLDALNFKYANKKHIIVVYLCSPSGSINS